MLISLNRAADWVLPSLLVESEKQEIVTVKSEIFRVGRRHSLKVNDLIRNSDLLRARKSKNNQRIKNIRYLI